MKTLLKVFAVVLFIVFSTAAFAQEWTKAQKEVWQVVEDTWAKLAKNDIDGAAANFHEKYQGWNEDLPLPVAKAKVVQIYKNWTEKVKIESYDIEPARISVTDDGAVVCYYFSTDQTMTVGEDKKQQHCAGKNVEFYVKEGGKWLLLGDLTVYEDEEDD